MNDSVIPNVLAGRYASSGMRAIWSPEGKIRLERELWIAVMKAQRQCGLDLPESAIAAYEAVRDNVDLQWIEERERVTRHDVKARIEAFCNLAGFEHIHKGMTSRDLTENVEQLQVFRSLTLIRNKAAALLGRWSEQSAQYADWVMTARTHNVAAQASTLGKRLAMYGEETLHAVRTLQHCLETYPVRGLKGAVGTQADLLTLFAGDRAKVAQVEEQVLKHLGIPHVCVAVGQVYPRSLDLAVLSALNLLASAPSNFAKTLRIMAGHETASEGFAKGQVGSSAMPHKMNARSCERINGFAVILKGYLAMAAQLAGDQWNEGDVSCSVVRRVCLPDAFFAMDGLLETILTVLDQWEPSAFMLQRENERYFPFLCTTTILMEAVKAGAGRETAHEAIKEHAVAVAKELRQGKLQQNDLLNRLAADSRLHLKKETLDALMADGSRLTGMAKAEIEEFRKQAETWLEPFAQVAGYQPQDIL